MKSFAACLFLLISIASSAQLAPASNQPASQIETGTQQNTPDPSADPSTPVGSDATIYMETDTASPPGVVRPNSTVGVPTHPCDATHSGSTDIVWIRKYQHAVCHTQDCSRKDNPNAYLKEGYSDHIIYMCTWKPNTPNDQYSWLPVCHYGAETYRYCTPKPVKCPKCTDVAGDMYQTIPVFGGGRNTWNTCPGGTGTGVDGGPLPLASSIPLGRGLTDAETAHINYDVEMDRQAAAADSLAHANITAVLMPPTTQPVCQAVPD